MNDFDKEYLLSNLQDYLERQGIRTDKFFRCINPAHLDNNASMKLFDDNKVYCFGCQATYDLFGAIAAIENISKKDAFKKALEYYSRGQVIQAKYEKPMSKKVDNNSKKDYTKAYDIWHKVLLSRDVPIDYLSSRGIGLSTINKFNLGYNQFHFGKRDFNAIIIPINDNTFTARNTDTDSEFRHYKPRNCHTEILNSTALTNDIPYCAITEGEFDCLSFEEVGINAISLGSVSNVNKFIKANKKIKNFILALDNDEAGKKATKELELYLQENKIPFTIFDNCGYKDANEALIKDRENFEQSINTIVERIKRKHLKQNEEMT